MKNKINIGCGEDIKEGWDNLDNHSNNGANIIADLNNLPLDIEDNNYEYVLCSHVIEDWSNPMPILKELIRICKIGGLIEIRVPHEKSANASGSIYHTKAYNLETLTSFLDSKKDYTGYNLPVELVSAEVYSCVNWKNPIVALYKTLCISIRNFFGVYGERLPFIRSIASPDMSIKVIWRKIK